MALGAILAILKDLVGALREIWRFLEFVGSVARVGMAINLTIFHFLFIDAFDALKIRVQLPLRAVVSSLRVLFYCFIPTTF